LDSLNQVEVVHVSVAVSFSIENEEFTILLVELNIGELTISGDLEKSIALEVNAQVFEVESFSNFSSSRLDDIESSAESIIVNVVSDASLDLNKS
jgi:hypothetical protein